MLLLDEPLGALDLKLRREMQLELKRIQRESGITFIFVTHDQEEALTMSDRVAVMSAGHILQLGTPEDIYNEPQSAFVADFIGDSDIMAGTMVRDKLVRFLGCDFPCVDTGFGENADVDVVLRPEDVKLKPADDPVQGVPQGVVESLLFKGVHYEMKVRVGDSVTLSNHDMEVLQLTVSGIYENHVYNYAIVSPETIAAQWGREPEQQMAVLRVREGRNPSAAGAAAHRLDGVASVTVSQELAKTVNSMMAALDLVVVVVVICAGILAVIVLYNLTNININERIREIATM